LASRYDIAVVGGGPGGYVAALRASQLGARTLLIERDRLGGTCLNRGCIPTKAMLQSSELYTLAQRGPEFGIVTDDHPRVDLGAAISRRDAVVKQLVNGVGSLLKAAGVEVVNGHGKLRGKGVLEVDGQKLEAENVIVATGSVASSLPIPGVEHTVNSDGILQLRKVPARMAVIGGGVVGMEWGALFAAFGTRVTVLEMLPQILPMVESDLVAQYRRHFESMGGVVHTEARVQEVRRQGSELKVLFALGGEGGEVPADVVLLATGRQPYTDGLGLEQAGVELERGRVKVDGRMRTSAPGVWAIGDVIGGIMLAHVASYEGVCAVENITGARPREADYHAAPNCIYTDPEIAHVGLGEREARERGLKIEIGRFPLTASARALTLGQAEGTVKVVTEAGSGRILGVHMLGPRVTDVVAEATLAVQQNLTVDQLDLTMHAHPTLPESFLQAALASQGRAIEIPNRPRRAAALAASNQTKETEASMPGPVQETPTQTNKPESRRVAIRSPKLALSKEHRTDLLKIHHLMALIRRFEERSQEQYTKAKIGGYCHLNLGEEATVVGGILPLKPNDYIFTSYREHGHAIARGIDPRAVMAELFGRETGTSHGRGGSMHLFDLAHRFMGGYGIVGGHLPLAVGAAWAIRYEKKKDVVFCLFGDGATNIGAFHESLNFSKVFNLPVVWFCVNNQYGMGTAVENASAVREMYRKACAYDMEAIQVDGMNVLEVLARTSEIVEKTRADSQPRFIEAVTYRFKGHSVVDPDKYRSEEEKHKWLEGDPVHLFETQLVKAGLISEAELAKLKEEIEAEVEEAVQFADQSPDPNPKDLYRYLYAGEWEAGGNG
jgi:dihydrolipoamide dehydrogenase